MSGIYAASFWKDAAERAVKTFAQALVASLTLAVGLAGVEWWDALSVAGLAALISVLTSLISGAVGDTQSASLLPPPTGRHAAP